MKRIVYSIMAAALSIVVGAAAGHFVYTLTTSEVWAYLSAFGVGVLYLVLSIIVLGVIGE